MERERQRRRRRAQATRYGRRPRHRRAQETKRERVHERGVGRVEQDVAEVVAEGVHAPDDVVGAMSQPGQRRPVPHDRRGEHPPHLTRAEAPVGGVVEEVPVVVELHPAAPQRRQEDEQRDGSQGDCHQHVEGEAAPPVRKHAVHHHRTSARPATSLPRRRSVSRVADSVTQATRGLSADCRTARTQNRQGLSRRSSTPC